MSKARKASAKGVLLDLWRPPEGAGDPLGCLATTYTFAPGLFDEQCLGRFLEIESEPNREDLPFLLERERLLGGVYAGVLVDQTQAGVEHSLRWDVLPVRLRGKQHAKLSLLAWSRHVRIIVASANLTEQGYRTNYEVAASVDLTPHEADTGLLGDALQFLRSLLRFVPGAAARPPEVQRADGFLNQVERHVRDWEPLRRGAALRQQLVFTLPASGPGRPTRSSLEEAVESCRRRGGSPYETWVASPFFDIDDDDASRVTAALCKLMARGGRRDIWFSVRAIPGDGQGARPRLVAPRALLRTPSKYQASANVEILPDQDEDKNGRPWHAKMLALRADDYFALMIGSSNFTVAGMGVGEMHHAEANLLTIADREAYARESGALQAVWPSVKRVDDPEAAEWLGARPEGEEEEEAAKATLPAGFLSATYRAGTERHVVLRFDAAHLPADWSIVAAGREPRALLSADAWGRERSPNSVAVPWQPVQPPERLLVQWAGHEAFLPLNVENTSELPPPPQLEQMSADDMLSILAASDPSAAVRAWAKGRQPAEEFDSDLDSATPIDLDPLRRYDLQATFLHRIRRRARVLAQLRTNLERPVWTTQALECRLRGLIGLEALARRLANEVTGANEAVDEGVLTLADFLIVLREVDYRPHDGSLPKAKFEEVFRPFLSELTRQLQERVNTRGARISEAVLDFWERVVARCQR